MTEQKTPPPDPPERRPGQPSSPPFPPSTQGTPQFNPVTPAAPGDLRGGPPRAARRGAAIAIAVGLLILVLIAMGIVVYMAKQRTAAVDEARAHDSALAFQQLLFGGRADSAFEMTSLPFRQSQPSESLEQTAVLQRRILGALVSATPLHATANDREGWIRMTYGAEFERGSGTVVVLLDQDPQAGFLVSGFDLTSPLIEDALVSLPSSEALPAGN
ncbi:MAG: hypothetical protein RLY93_01150 [Sumerlaeia bacterium]